MEEEGGNGCSDHVLHNMGVESPDGTCTTLNQSLLTQSLLGDLGDVLLPAQFWIQSDAQLVEARNALQGHPI